MSAFAVKYYGILLFVGFAFSPLFFWPNSPVVHEVPKVWLVLGWIEVLVGVTMVRILVGDKPNKLKNLTPIGLYLLVSVFVSIAGVDTQKSFFGNYYRLDGLVTLFHLVAFALSMALFVRMRERSLILKGILTGAALVSFWAVIEFFGKLFSMQEFALATGNPIGVSFGQPNFLGGYLAVTTPIYFYFLQKNKQPRANSPRFSHRSSNSLFTASIHPPAFSLRISGSLNKQKVLKTVLLLLLSIQIVVLFLTHSVGALLTLVFGLAFYFAYKKGRKGMAVFGIVFVVLAFGYLWKTLSATPGIDLVYEGRQRIILKTISGVMATGRYLTGFGVANVDYAFNAGVWPISISGDVYLDKAHSTLLESFIATGFIGLGTYLFLIATVLKSLYRKSKRSKSSRLLFFVLLLYLFHSQTNIISISEDLLFWLTVGLQPTES